MHITVVMTREEIEVVLTEHLRKKIPDLQEIKSGLAQQYNIAVTIKEGAPRK